MLAYIAAPWILWDYESWMSRNWKQQEHFQFLYHWMDVLSVRAKLQNASTVDVDTEFSIQILGDGNGYLPLFSYSKPLLIVDFQLLWLEEGRQMLRAPNHLTHAQIHFLRTLAQIVPNVEIGHGTRSWEKHPEKTSILHYGGAPKIAKLVYSSNNYGLWYL